MDTSLGPGSSPQHEQDAKARLSNDMQQVVSDTRVLLRNAASATADSMAGAGTQLRDMQAGVRQRVGHAAEWTDAYAHDNPWKVAGISGLLGIFVGLLISRN